ncbi:hypothetical protein HMPREF1248_0521 [Coriobacteriaceae bacterium BV3Ac1]|nr:hypothetical protein HMPREF1248_0521 [Coriobacteriaceae bacterium BV3Ac1]
MHQGKATNFYRQKVGYQFSDKIFLAYKVCGISFAVRGAAVAILLLAVQNTTYFG